MKPAKSKTITINPVKVKQYMAELAPKFFEFGIDPRKDHKDILQQAMSKHYRTDHKLSKREADQRAWNFVDHKAALIPFVYDNEAADRMLAARNTEVAETTDTRWGEAVGIEALSDDSENVESILSEMGIHQEAEDRFIF